MAHTVILNLSDLNEYVHGELFKLNTIRDVVQLVYPGCCFAPVDFTNAYYSVSIVSQYKG